MALLIKPQPFSTDLHRLFNSVFDDVATGAAQQRWTPAMDLVEVDNHFVLKAQSLSETANAAALVIGQTMTTALASPARDANSSAAVNASPDNALVAELDRVIKAGSFVRCRYGQP